VLTAAEQKIATRPRKTRKCFVLLRAQRHAWLDADLQPTRAHSSSPAPGGHAPVEAGLLARATLLQASWHVGGRDAGELPVLDTRWPMGLDGLGAAPPPVSQGPRLHCRRRLITHHWDQPRLARTGAVAEPSGGVGARPRRAVLDSPPLWGAGRVEAPLPLLGHARRQAVGLAAPALGTAAEVVGEAAGLPLVGHRSLKAALALAWGEPRARSRARGVVLEEGPPWPCGLEPQQTLVAQPPPPQEVRETITPRRTPDPAPAPEGGPGGRRLKPHVAPDRRLSLEDRARRHGRTSRATTCNGFNEPGAVEVESPVTREGGGRPAHEPEPAAVARLAEAWEQAPGLRPRAIALGDLARPRMAPGAAQGVSMIARPWPQGGPLGTKHAVTWDFVGREGTGPGGPSLPMVPGKPAQLPATAGDACAWRAQGTKATHGQGTSVSLREDEPGQPKRRAPMKTPRGRASLRQRTAVAHTIAPQWVQQGRRARDKGLRKHQFDGRRHAAVSNLQIAARYEEEHRLAS